jgi:hypothetical protein
MGDVRFIYAHQPLLKCLPSQHCVLREAMTYRLLAGIVLLVLVGSAQAQKLPMCYRTGTDTFISLTFAHCQEERSGYIRGILRGGPGVEVLFSRSGYTSFTKVDSVDLSQKKETDDVAVWAHNVMRNVNGAGSKQIKDEGIPDWLFAFVETHFNELSQYRSEAGAGFVGVERVMAERQKIAAAQAAAQRQRDEQERQQQAARDAEAAQQARAQAAQREQEMQGVRRQLGALNAGQLFARADEYRSKGQIDEAREALRLLVAKFPNHGLAPAAAQQLASLPQTDGQGAIGGIGGTGGVGGPGGVGGTGGSSAMSAVRSIDACDPNAHLRIKEMLARFTEPLLRQVSDAVMPIRVDAEKNIAAARNQGLGIPGLVRELQKVVTEHRQQKNQAAENYCKMVAGCNTNDAARVSARWPEDIRSNVRISGGNSASEAMQGAWVAAHAGEMNHQLILEYVQRCHKP